MQLPEVNFLPHRVWARRARWRRHLSFAGLGALGLLVVLVGVGHWLDARNQRWADELRRAQTEVAQLKQRLVRVQQQAQLGAQRRAELEQWLHLRERQAVVVRWWAQLARALPPGAYWLTLEWSPQLRRFSGVAAHGGDVQGVQAALNGAFGASSQWTDLTVHEITSKRASDSKGEMRGALRGPTPSHFVLQAQPLSREVVR